MSNIVRRNHDPKRIPEDRDCLIMLTRGSNLI